MFVVYKVYCSNENLKMKMKAVCRKVTAIFFTPPDSSIKQMEASSHPFSDPMIIHLSSIYTYLASNRKYLLSS